MDRKVYSDNILILNNLFICRLYASYLLSLNCEKCDDLHFYKSLAHSDIVNTDYQINIYII